MITECSQQWKSEADKVVTAILRLCTFTNLLWCQWKPIQAPCARKDEALLQERCIALPELSHYKFVKSKQLTNSEGSPLHPPPPTQIYCLACCSKCQ